MEQTESIQIKAEPVLASKFKENTISFSAWQGVRPQDAFEAALANHLIVIHTTPKPVNVFDRADAVNIGGAARPGDINLLSSGEWSSCRWEDDLSFYRLELTPSYVKELAENAELSYAGEIEFHHRFRARDPKLLQMTQWIKEELESGMGGKLYLDSLANLFGIHLLQNYSSIGKPRTAPPAALSEDQIKRGIEYMRAHLDREISLEELAQSVNVSAAHLVRLFKKVTGYTPHQYLIHLRVEQAKMLIRSKSLSLTEIAAQVGFADQSHMHRHFKRRTGFTPREYSTSR